MLHVALVQFPQLPSNAAGATPSFGLCSMTDRLPPPGVPRGVSLALHSNTLLALMFLCPHPHPCDLSLQPDPLTYPESPALPAVIHPNEQIFTPDLFLSVLLLSKHEQKEIITPTHQIYYLLIHPSHSNLCLSQL